MLPCSEVWGWIRTVSLFSQYSSWPWVSSVIFPGESSTRWRDSPPVSLRLERKTQGMETSSGLASSKVIAEGKPLAEPIRVAVVTSDVPFVEGGHRVIARSLADELERHGFRVEIIRTAQNRFGRQFAAYLANWLTDVSESGDGVHIDQVISLRFPSYAVRHRRHVCWLNHRMREYYDLWPRFTAQLSRKGLVKERTRRWMMHRLDKYLLTRNVTRLFAQSKTVQERLMRWGKIPSEV